MTYSPFGSPTYPLFQSKFLSFHERIKLKNTDENATLRDKRTKVLDRLRDYCPYRFDSFNQGSYAMGVGCRPPFKHQDFDIDVGIVFSGTPAERPENPLTVKRWVRDAVDGHTSVPAQWMRHCVRVQYVKAGNEIYHVDLAVYWQDVTTNNWGDRVLGNRYLAIGKEHSGVDHREWQRAEPEELRDLIKGYLSGEDGKQFRRVIRYLKRWKDEKFPSEGNASPVGIGLAVAAHAGFQPHHTYGASTQAQYDDFAAVRSLVDWIRARFTYVIENQAYVNRLVLPLPVQPGLDVFRNMTGQQMKEFKERLDTLAGLLSDAERSENVAYLTEAFGPDMG